MPQQLPDCVLHFEVNGVEYRRPIAARNESVDCHRGIVPQVHCVDKSDFRVGLRREVEAKIGLAHGSDRVSGHGMTVDALDGAVGRAGEEIAKSHVTAEMRRGNDDGNE